MAADMQAVAARMALLPYGQIKKLMDDELLAILARYGIAEERK